MPFDETAIGISLTSVAPQGWQYLSSSSHLTSMSFRPAARIPRARACSVPEPSVLLMKTRTSVDSSTGIGFRHRQFLMSALQGLIPIPESSCLDTACPQMQTVLLFGRPRSRVSSSSRNSS